ncbi:MAG: hypothetical protein HY538_00880 [Deltaproteobacteria bacterium]|nr:hypothetical protein [Deltaproteobacteria bacterium]
MIKTSFRFRLGIAFLILLNCGWVIAFELGVKESSVDGIPFLEYTIQSHSDLAQQLITTGKGRMPISIFAVLNRLDFEESGEENELSFVLLKVETFPNKDRMIHFLATTENLSKFTVRGKTLDAIGHPNRGPYIRRLGEFSLQVDPQKKEVMQGAYLIHPNNRVAALRFAYRERAIKSVSAGLTLGFIEAVGNFEGDHPAVVTLFEKTGFSKFLGEILGFVVETNYSGMDYVSEKNELTVSGKPVFEKLDMELTHMGLYRIAFES